MTNKRELLKTGMLYLITVLTVMLMTALFTAISSLPFKLLPKGGYLPTLGLLGLALQIGGMTFAFYRRKLSEKSIRLKKFMPPHLIALPVGGWFFGKFA